MINRYSRFCLDQLLCFLSSARFALKAANTKPNKLSRNSVAVLITPWYGTQVPWTSFAIGLLLRARGNHVVLVFEALDIGPKKSIPEKVQLIFIKFTLLVLQFSGIPVRHVCKDSNHEYSSNVDYSQEAFSYATWLVRGESNITHSLLASLNRSLAANELIINHIFSGLNVDIFLIPGGMCKNSALWVKSCMRANIRYATFDDGGVGKLMFSCHGIAAQHSDIPIFVESISSAAMHCPSITTKILELSANEITKRSNGLLGSDGTVSQSPSSCRPSINSDSYALICLNSIWDSASLGLHTCFSDSLAWIRATIGHILANSSLDIVVRQHPHEKYDFSRGSDDLKVLFFDWFDHSPRIIFEDCYSSANTYDLLNGSTFAVVHTSTIGLEGSFRGKPVVTQSSSYYAPSGAVFYANDISSYFALIDKAVNKSLTVSAEMKEKAGLFFYASQMCSFIDTELAPSRPSKMQGINFSEILSEHACSMILQSIETGVSFQELTCLSKLCEPEGSHA
jgi:hypothetical protein